MIEHIKVKNEYGVDRFMFTLSDTLGLIPFRLDDWNTTEKMVIDCMSDKDYFCTRWVLEYGNLDYLKADKSGKCNDSNIVLDGVNNTSCH